MCIQFSSSISCVKGTPDLRMKSIPQAMDLPTKWKSAAQPRQWCDVVLPPILLFNCGHLYPLVITIGIPDLVLKGCKQ